MSKSKVVSPLQERAKLRASEKRRMEHAYEVLIELVHKHFPSEQIELQHQELYVLKRQLEVMIENQHIKDAGYAKFKVKNDLAKLEGF